MISQCQYGEQNFNSVENIERSRGGDQVQGHEIDGNSRSRLDYGYLFTALNECSPINMARQWF